MKKMFLIAAAFACAVPVFLAAKDYKIDEVYDLFAPTKFIPNDKFPNDPTKGYTPPNRGGSVSIDGDLPGGRVSLFPVKQGTPGDPKTDLLLEKDANGNDVIPPEPDCKTVYCSMDYCGGEDSRAFHLRGYNVPFRPDAWTRVVIEFMPRRDGKVWFGVGHGIGHIHKEVNGKSIGSKYYDHGYARYARFWAKNTTLRDLNVGSAAAWNISPFYHFPRQIKPKPQMEKNAPVTKSMRSPMGLSQLIPVKKDKKVIIVFYIHGDDYFRAKRWFDPDEDKDKDKKVRRRRRRH